LKFNEKFEKQLTILYEKKIQRFELFDNKESYKNKDKLDDKSLYKVQKIPEKDADFVKVTKLIYGFRENPEFIFRILRFLDDLRTSNLSFAVKERQNVFNKIDNSLFLLLSLYFLLIMQLPFSSLKPFIQDIQYISDIFFEYEEQLLHKGKHLCKYFG
jgi:hypothetical protein